MNGSTPILCSIAFNHHDSSVAIGRGSSVLLVLEAERWFRQRKKLCSAKEMESLILVALQHRRLRLQDIGVWILGTLNNPWLTEDERRTPTYRVMEKAVLGLTRHTLIVNHHFAHAASFLFSPFEHAAIATCDGGGDFGQRVSFFAGKHNQIDEAVFSRPDAITTKLYGQSSTYLFDRPFCEGKLMALAGLGTANDGIVTRVREILPALNHSSFVEGQSILRQSFPELRGAAAAGHATPQVVAYAASVQSVFCDRRLDDVQTFLHATGEDSLVIAGGSALNLELNAQLNALVSGRLFALPCCDDTGIALCGLAVGMSVMLNSRPTAELPFLGWRDHQDVATRPIDHGDVVEFLDSGGVLLVHIGRGEVGPRALGHRSFVGSPFVRGMKRLVSESIKSRESYRPLAPILHDDVLADYFYGAPGLLAPFMLSTFHVREPYATVLGQVVHADGTARCQTIKRQPGDFLSDVLACFETRHHGLLINTSLNLAGQTMSCALEDTLAMKKRLQVPSMIVFNGRLLSN